MKKSINFIGLGAQRCGTSWIYAQLYEHPQICMPRKEIHFFSKDENWQKGIGWYENIFKNCPKGKLRGEFSTSYLPSKIAAERIYQYYPKTKLITCLRNPVQRAFSAFKNDIMGGVLPKNKSFEKGLSENKDYIIRGFYFHQLKNYLSLFSREQILILIYEDLKKDPKEYIKKIYRFLGVDDSFLPSMLNKVINKGRTPQFVFIDEFIYRVASFLRIRGFHKLVWLGKKTGIPEFIRKLNTQKKKTPELKESTRLFLEKIFAKDVAELSEFLNRDLSEIWFNYKRYL